MPGRGVRFRVLTTRTGLIGKVCNGSIAAAQADSIWLAAKSICSGCLRQPDRHASFERHVPKLLLVEQGIGCPNEGLLTR